MKVIKLEEAKAILHGKSLDTEADFEYVCNLLDDAAVDCEEVGKEPAVTSMLAFYDKEETYTNCTVQILTNSKTGDVSIGWYHNEPDIEDYDEEPDEC